jgi:hypothetical protein
MTLFKMSLFNNVILSTIVFQNVAFQNVAFQNVAFQIVAFQNAAFQNAAFQNVAFQNVAFQNVAFQNAAFQNAAFQNDSFQNVLPPTVLAPYLRSRTLPCLSAYQNFPIEMNKNLKFKSECQSANFSAKLLPPENVPNCIPLSVSSELRDSVSHLHFLLFQGVQVDLEQGDRMVCGKCPVGSENRPKCIQTNFLFKLIYFWGRNWMCMC